MGTIIAVVVILVACAVGIFGAIWIGPRAGVDTRNISPTKRPGLVLVLLVMVAFVPVWAFAEGRTALGIGILVGLLVIDVLVFPLLHVRRSRR